VIVATDDARIADAVRSFGGEVMMTRADHPSGTDRVAEVASAADAELVLNIQGDEPELEPDSIDRLVGLMREDPDCPMGTLACPFAALSTLRGRPADPNDPNTVKVVLTADGRALYFSRSLIPYPRDREVLGSDRGRTGPYLHLGIYAYSREFLLRLAKMPPTPLEKIEKLEQLRVLESGYDIRVGVVNRASVGIDTPDDYAAFVQRQARGGNRRSWVEAE
jgi:3-deoxy-manno-octulosonate cytidylyltransferase (CMP-KDO synthetase)